MAGAASEAHASARSIDMTDDRAGSDVAALLGSARRMLGALRIEFDRSVVSLARVCATGAMLDAARLDQRQLASYELALASAYLLAAETAVGPVAEAEASGRVGSAADTGPEGFDARLSLVYAVEAIGDVI